MHDDYIYRTGDSVEVELSPGKWQKGIFQSYIPVDVNKNHDLNIELKCTNKNNSIVLLLILSIPPERVRRIKNER